ARDHAEERSLAGAVGADHAHDAAGRQLEREVLEEELVAERLGEPGRFDHRGAETWPGRDVDLVGVGALLLLVRQELFVRRVARLALGLTRTRRHANPLQLVLGRAPPGALRSFFLLESLVLLLEPRGVIALPGNTLAA